MQAQLVDASTPTRVFINGKPMDGLIPALKVKASEVLVKAQPDPLLTRHVLNEFAAIDDFERTKPRAGQLLSSADAILREASLARAARGKGAVHRLGYCPEALTWDREPRDPAWGQITLGSHVYRAYRAIHPVGQATERADSDLAAVHAFVHHLIRYPNLTDQRVKHAACDGYSPFDLLIDYSAAVILHLCRGFAAPWITEARTKLTVARRLLSDAVTDGPAGSGVKLAPYK